MNPEHAIFLAAARALALLAATSPIPAQARQLVEQPWLGLPLDQTFARAAVMGDVDGDGDIDIVRGHELLLNDGRGNYLDVTTARLPAGKGAPETIAMGDVDADGDLDLLLAGFRQPVRLYVNDGSGVFRDAAAQMPTGSADGASSALGDVDGDGDLDLILGASGQNRLYTNDGRGQFTDETPGRIPVDGDQAVGTEFVDVDADGDLDLVFANTAITGGRSQNRLYLNDGSGVFGDVTATQLPTFMDITRSMAVGDVDGDGDADIICANVYDPDRLYLNDGTGQFTVASTPRLPILHGVTEAMTLSDVDGDGDLDVLAANRGEGSFSTGQQNRLLLNDGSGSFVDRTATRLPAEAGQSYALALADADGDGDLDALVVNSRDDVRGHRTRLLFNDGAGRFAEQQIRRRMPADGTASGTVAVGDVDGDGDLDLFFGHLLIAAGDQHDLFLNDGSGHFVDASHLLPTITGAASQANAAEFVDVDADRDLDLIVGTADQTLVYQNDGSGRFTDATPPALTGAGVISLAIGDVDQDGDPDLLIGTSGQNRLFLNDGSGGFTDVTLQRLPVAAHATQSLSLVDVDGDGDHDLVTGNSGLAFYGELNRIYLNDGRGRFTDATATRLPAHRDPTTSLVAGDIDGDGDQDLVVVNADYSFQGGCSWPNRLYLNDGTGVFVDASARLDSTERATDDVVLGDIDGDGDLDLVLAESRAGRCRSRGRNAVLLNRGGTFDDVSFLQDAGDSTTDLALVDIDLDGDLDLLCANWSAPDVHNRLYLNLGRQLDAPVPPQIGTSWRLDVYAVADQPSAVDVAFVSVSPLRASIPLSSFGTVLIDPTTSTALPPFFVSNLDRFGSLTIPVPNESHLVGVPVHAQAALLRFPAPPRLTNLVTSVIGR